MGKRTHDPATVEGVFAGTVTDPAGQRRELSIERAETVDCETGVVVEIRRSIGMPGIGRRVVYRDRAYARRRLAAIEEDRLMVLRERTRNDVRQAIFKPPRRRSRNVETTTVCPDCDGAQEFEGERCRCCDGRGWITV